MTKAQRVLEYIASNPDGRSLKEIQTFVLKMNGTQKWIDKGYLALNPKTGEVERTHAGRGYWCDYLYGTAYYPWSRSGFLHTHCIRLPSGKWKATEPAVGPFRGKETKSLVFNEDCAVGAHQRYVKSLPKCPSCEQPIYKGFDLSPDKQAHIIQWSGAYHSDCKDRVWRIEVMDYRAEANQLTKLTRSEVNAAQTMAGDLSKDYNEQTKMVWKMLGENLA